MLSGGKHARPAKKSFHMQREMSLEDFELLEKLGKGAFGEVFMAQ